VSFAAHFRAAAGKVIRAFASLNADWMFIGAIPVAAWGQPRATTDADFAVSLDLLEAESLDRALIAEGFEKLSGPTEIPQKRLILSKYWESATSFGIDVFFSSGYATGKFQRVALARKKFVTFEGQAHPVASPEDLILYKVLAYRQKDLDDVGTVLERQWATLEWEHVRQWSDQLGIANLMKDVLLQYADERGLPPRLPWA
jgi:hypothetical protein